MRCDLLEFRMQLLTDQRFLGVTGRAQGDYLKSVLLLSNIERGPFFGCLMVGRDPMTFGEWRREVKIRKVEDACADWAELEGAGLIKEVEIEGIKFSRLMVMPSGCDAVRKMREGVGKGSGRGRSTVDSAGVMRRKSVQLQQTTTIHTKQGDINVVGGELVDKSAKAVDNSIEPVDKSDMRKLAEGVGNGSGTGRSGVDSVGVVTASCVTSSPRARGVNGTVITERVVSGCAGPGPGRGSGSGAGGMAGEIPLRQSNGTERGDDNQASHASNGPIEGSVREEVNNGTERVGQSDATARRSGPPAPDPDPRPGPGPAHPDTTRDMRLLSSYQTKLVEAIEKLVADHHSRIAWMRLVEKLCANEVGHARLVSTCRNLRERMLRSQGPDHPARWLMAALKRIAQEKHES